MGQESREDEEYDEEEEEEQAVGPVQVSPGNSFVHPVSASIINSI